MGVYADYIGSMNIPDQLSETFSNQIMKIFNYGGMMEVRYEKKYGHKIELIKPVEIVPGGKTNFYYNYFEDDSWETVEYDASDCHMITRKIGDHLFRKVILVAYSLYEIYDSGIGFPVIDGDLFNPYPYIAWINHLFGTDFSLEKRKNLWEIMEVNARYRAEIGYTPDSVDDLIPSGVLLYAGGIELADLYIIEEGTGELAEEVVPGSYPADVLACKKCILKYLSDGKKTNRVDNLYSLVCMKREHREKIADPLIKKVAEWSLVLPARIIVYLIAEETGKEFWDRWDEIRTSVYHDERVKPYADEELKKKREKEWKKPIQGMKTVDFLKEYDWFDLFAPDEIRKKPDYLLSDDDRLYWWDGSDEVIISEKMDKWIKELAERHKTIVENMESPDKEKSDSFLKEFVTLIHEVDEKYKRILPFYDMFYEFLENGHRKEYRAAVTLLRELSDENWEEGSVIRFLESVWDLTSRKITFNPGRLNIKRYLSIMANRSLRKKYFGF